MQICRRDTFDDLQAAILTFADACAALVDIDSVKARAKRAIAKATEDMQARYEEPRPRKKSAVQKSQNAKSPVDDVFRDIDE